jgi:MYXO-CTERM domain-containing protein
VDCSFLGRTSKRGTVKKLFLLAVLVVLAAPFSASAHPNRHHIRASEVAGMGVGAAALVGVAGYFLLRRRNS